MAGVLRFVRMVLLDEHARQESGGRVRFNFLAMRMYWKATGFAAVAAVLMGGVLWFGDAKATTAEKVERPFFYVANYYYGDRSGTPSELHAIDRVTGEGAVVYRNEETPLVELVAAPELGFDGRVFIHAALGDSDNPYLNLQEVNTLTDGVIDVAWADELPTRDALAVSPDQTKIAAVYDNEMLGDASREIVVYDVLTGERTVIGQLTGNEHFARVFGENVFAGAYDYHFHWTDLRCVRASIYEDVLKEADGQTELRHKEYRDFCLAE